MSDLDRNHPYPSRVQIDSSPIDLEVVTESEDRARRPVLASVIDNESGVVAASILSFDESSPEELVRTLLGVLARRRAAEGEAEG